MLADPVLRRIPRGLDYKARISTCITAECVVNWQNPGHFQYAIVRFLLVSREVRDREHRALADRVYGGSRVIEPHFIAISRERILLNLHHYPGESTDKHGNSYLLNESRMSRKVRLRGCARNGNTDTTM